MPAPAACLFDLDGLLLDTEPLHGQAWAAAASHFGATLSDLQLRQLRGRRRQDCADQVVAWLNQPISSDALLAIQQPIARRLLAGALPMPGAEALVQTCSRLNVPMALVTSSAAEAVRRKSAPHPWLNLIRTRVLGDDPELTRGKPAADPFLLAAARLGVEARECWALEDSLAGSTAALAAGCRLWLLSAEGHGLNPGELPKGQCDIVGSLSQVLDRLMTETESDRTVSGGEKSRPQ